MRLDMIRGLRPPTLPTSIDSSSLTATGNVVVDAEVDRDEDPLGVGLDPGGELRRRARVPQVHAGELEAATHEMGVIVDEPGDDQPPAGLKDLG